MFLVVRCSRVHMVMQAKLGTWSFKHTAMHARVVNVVVGSGMHLVLACRNSVED